MIRPRAARPRAGAAVARALAAAGLALAAGAASAAAADPPAAADAAPPAAADPPAAAADPRSAAAPPAAPPAPPTPGAATGRDLPPLPASMRDAGRAPLPPIVLGPPAPPPLDRRPVYVGAGLVLFAALLWWNRQRRAALDRAEGAARPGATGRGDPDADDLQAAAAAAPDDARAPEEPADDPDQR